jgi:hypothetical protein
MILLGVRAGRGAELRASRWTVEHGASGDRLDLARAQAAGQGERREATRMPSGYTGGWAIREQARSRRRWLRMRPAEPIQETTMDPSHFLYPTQRPPD